MSKKSNLKISVIVPIYNAEKYLERCIDSLVNQTYTNLEIILVDDGSEDQSLEYCMRYHDSDNRVIVLHKENGGQVSAKKAGKDIATGTYVTYVDADDYIDMDAFETVVNQLDVSLPDIMAYGLIEEYPNKRIVKNNHYQEGVYNKNAIEKYILPSMLSYGEFFDFGILPNSVCKFIKKSLIDKISIHISSEVVFGEDADETYQLVVNADTMQFIDYMPYHYCKRNDSIIWKKVDPISIEHLENDLKEAFIKARCFNVMSKQLEDYIKFVTLLKNPSLILSKEDIFQTSKIALYGAGGFGQAVYGEYSEKIKLWVDRDYEQYSVRGYNVSSIDELLNKQDLYDVIYISILNTAVCRVIKEQLIHRGIKKNIYYFKCELPE